MTVPEWVTSWIEVDDTDMHTHAWEITDLSPLFNMPTIRGSDRLIPGASGLKPYRRRATATRYVFPMFVYGECDEDGDPFDDPFEGLLTNIDTLLGQVAHPGDAGDGTVTAVWHRPGALDDLTTVCHVTAFESAGRGPNARHAEFRFEISVPSGAWTPVP